ncbi:MAG: endolytic transglycosylase MltG [Candidatus Paceibacterota bacterium]|jgi:UPF0755 protein
MQNKNIFHILGVVIFLAFFYFLFFTAPSDFPVNNVIKIETGVSLRSVSLQLKQEHVISSMQIFEFFVMIYGGEKHIISADYLFEKKLSVFEIARRITGGEHRTVPVVITIPEGFDIKQIGDIASLKLENFDKAKFFVGAKDLEGYLFPDTYFFFTNANETNVIKSMTENFNKKITPLLPEITLSGKSEKDIIIMASIIEKESKGDMDREIISGILWKRISKGMPLQVDAAPLTYKTKGLPKSPIGNPGLAAILAAIHPQSSPYFYYLHDKNGKIYYAKTFAEHRANIKKYLTNI